MDALIIAVLLAAWVLLLGVLWWYYPYFRKPWSPKLRRLRKTNAAGSQPLQLSLRNPRLVIYKARRELELYDGETLIKTYRIALGLNPTDDKRKEGDGCTPEGEFYVCTKNDRSKFHLFLGLSYPDHEDAERGLKAGIVSKEEYDQILAAIAARKRPPWNTRLGGEIGIHGGGGTEVDWTQGGIAMDDKEIEELFMAVDLGSPVKILP